jgi:hypothetical protein
MDVDSNPAALKQEDSPPDLERRVFVKNSGKTLYIAPILTLLGSVQATAALPSEPPPPPGGAAPEAPAAPGPTE